jgi:hypothetical protein
MKKNANNNGTKSTEQERVLAVEKLRELLEEQHVNKAQLRLAILLCP